MNKSLSAVGVALSIVSFAFGATEEKLSAGIPEKPGAALLEATPAEAEALKEEEPAWFEAEVTLDLVSAYVWRNAVFNDELVFEPCVSFDFTRFEPFWIGGYVWQNWNMTGVQDCDRPRAMNETDFNVHLGATVWATEDEDYSLEMEIGNDFFTYRQVQDSPNSYELYVKATLNNPFANVYGQYSQAYEPVSGCYFELGLNREDKVGELFNSESDILNRFTVGLDWNLSFGSGKYFTNYLYGPIPGAYDPETEEYDEKNMSGGVGGTTIKGMCFYQVCEHFSLGATVGFTALLSGDARDAMDYAENGSMYKQLVWFGLQAKVEF